MFCRIDPKTGERQTITAGEDVLRVFCSRLDFPLLLTTQSTPMPLRAAGVNTSIVSATPTLRP